MCNLPHAAQTSSTHRAHIFRSQSPELLHTQAATHPSAAASSVLQRPSGASMLAAVSMPTVAGSRVSRAAVTRPRAAEPSSSSRAATLVAASEEEQAVSMEMAGPAAHSMMVWGCRMQCWCLVARLEHERCVAVGCWAPGLTDHGAKKAQATCGNIRHGGTLPHAARGVMCVRAKISSWVPPTRTAWASLCGTRHGGVASCRARSLMPQSAKGATLKDQTRPGHSWGVVG